MNNIKLTSFSHGAGCGCKISPAVLEKLLPIGSAQSVSPLLLVGHDTKDDAAVYNFGEGVCIMSTVDFFTPIVDDPFTYGAIASTNALSDIYAMGGHPLMAVALLGWPVDKIPHELAKETLEGSREACSRAGIPVAGGHSIDTLEPIFGLAVTGRALKSHVKQNSRATPGSSLYLTKPLGVGIVTTAHKKDHLLSPAHMQAAVDSMLMLNKFGAALGALPYVNAMTDVTGFGLLGHLIEMCEGSKLSAEIVYNQVPVFDFLKAYASDPDNIPGGTRRNLAAYGHKVQLQDESQQCILADPQTSGGLLVSISPGYDGSFQRVAAAHNLSLKPLGKMIEPQEAVVVIVR